MADDVDSAPERGTDEPRRAVVVSETVLMTSRRRAGWPPLLVLGVVAVVFGALILVNVWSSLRLLAIFAGALLLLAGVAQLVAALGAARRGAGLAGAVVTLLAGVVVLIWPEGSLKTLTVLVGLSFVVWGVVLAIVSGKLRGGGSSIGMVFGVILAIAGLVVVLWPGPTVTVLMALVGVGAILGGILAVAQALALRRM